MNYIKPKTKYTCNPCSSIAMNNGLGMRGACAPQQAGLAAASAPACTPPLALPRISRVAADRARRAVRLQCLL